MYIYRLLYIIYISFKFIIHLNNLFLKKNKDQKKGNYSTVLSDLERFSFLLVFLLMQTSETCQNKMEP